MDHPAGLIEGCHRILHRETVYRCDIISAESWELGWEDSCRSVVGWCGHVGPLSQAIHPSEPGDTPTSWVQPPLNTHWFSYGAKRFPKSWKVPSSSVFWVSAESSLSLKQISPHSCCHMWNLIYFSIKRELQFYRMCQYENISHVLCESKTYKMMFHMS